MVPVGTADRFTVFGDTHLAALAVLVAGGVALVVVGRVARRYDGRAEAISRGLAVAVVVVTLPLQVLYQTPAYWDLDRSLPLQLSDLASVAAAYALWTHRDWAVALTYFWGLTLTVQAVLTPDLVRDFPHPIFLLFWAMHLLTLWATAYLAIGLGLGPTWRTYRTSVAITAVWAATVFGFNLVAGTNYGYLNAKPGVASALDLLPEWPWYVLGEVVIIAALWALMTWPWVRRRVPSPAEGSVGVA